jgi:hypothetical protein
MASGTLARIRANPVFRGALIAPAAVATIFVLFNLTGAVEPETASRIARLGIVNLDEGATGPAGEMRLSEPIVEGLGGRVPFAVVPFDAEAAAAAALDAGEVFAVLVLPGDFTRTALGGAPVAARVFISDHLSVAEASVGAALPGMIEANLGTAVTMARLAVAARIQGPPGPPPVTVVTERLHIAASVRTRAAPIVLMFATGLGGLIGAILLHLATRGRHPRGAFPAVALVRTAVPLAATALASLLAAVMFGLATEAWDGFISVWLYCWLVGGTFMFSLVGLFSFLGLFAAIVGLPLVFYQGLAAGAVAPAAAAPPWVSWINDVLPLTEILTGWRTILIGGPEGSVPVTEIVVVLAVGVTLIWVATGVHLALRPSREVSEA